MTLMVTKHIEGYYEITLAPPEEIWAEILAGKMLCDDTTVLAMALGQGLVKLMSLFYQPDQEKVKPTRKEVTNEKVPEMSRDDPGG